MKNKNKDDEILKEVLKEYFTAEGLKDFFKGKCVMCNKKMFKKALVLKGEKGK